MIRAEFAKQLRRPRTMLAYGALAVLPAIAAIATKLNPPKRIDETPQTLIYRIATKSGLNFGFAALAFMTPFFLVLVVAAFAGDTVAGEANWGTLRYLLVRPVTRLRLLLAKSTVAVALTMLGLLLTVGVGLGAGVIGFGWHPLSTVIGEIGAGDAFGRLALATAYAGFSLFTMVTLGLLLSVLTDVSLGAMGGVIGINIVSQILDGIPNIGVIRSGLPTHYWSAWSSLFLDGAGFTRADMVRGLVSTVVYSAIFFSAALWWFRRKDILS